MYYVECRALYEVHVRGMELRLNTTFSFVEVLAFRQRTKT